MRQESVSARRSGDSSLLRRLNVSAALGAFLATESLTLRELRSAIGVSRPTAEEVLADLVAHQRIEEAPPHDGERRAGRPARRFRLRASSGHVLGADIGAHKVMVAVTDLRGNVLALRRRRVEPQQSARSRLGVVRAVIQSALAAAELDPSDLDGAACGVVGALRADSQVLDVQRANMGAELHPYSLPGFGDADIAGELAEHLGRPVLVANDVKVAALAERWHGAAQDADDIVYMFAGQRLGAGVLIGGQVHQGRHGAAGEVGTLPLLGWESAMQHLEAVATRLGPSGDTDIERVFAAAAGGSVRAVRVVDEIARALALGAATLVASVDPELVVLGGGMSRAGALIAEPFTRHLTAMCLFEPHVVISTMGDESVALGAVRLALDEVQRQLLDVDVPAN